MWEFGVDRDHIILDKQSGKRFQRTQYRRLLRKLKKDGLLYVKSIDRPGHSDRVLLQKGVLFCKLALLFLHIVNIPQNHPFCKTLRKLSIKNQLIKNYNPAKAHPL